VNLKKLARRLRCEASANPKKAVVLALLVLVALYRWAPLVGTWLGKEDRKGKPAVQGSSTEILPSPKNTVARDEPEPVASEGDGRYRWDQVVRWMEQDPRTVASAVLATRRDPLRRAGEAAESESKQEEEPQPVVPAVTPQELGLALSATVVGANRRVAMIDGRAYTEGKTIARIQDGQRFEFALVRILPRQVVLGQGDRQFVLAIPSGVSDDY
jgi:hypothetical protein